MFTRPLTTLLTLMLIGYAGSASAQEFRGARYTLPDDWVATDQDGVRVLAPSGLAQGELMLGMVLGVQPLNSTPTAKLAEVARTINAGATVISTSAMETAQHGTAGTLFLQSFEVRTNEAGRHARSVAILVRDQQCAVLVFVLSEAALQRHAAGMQALIGSLEVGGSALPVATSAKGAAIPTGSTPDKYPGSTGFRPSGRGVPVPNARIVDGRPQGLWWYPQARGSKIVALRVLYLPDTTCATSPRPGGPRLFDLEGQRRLGGVGTCSVADGKLTRTIDGHAQSGALHWGDDADGAFMDIGGARHRPLLPVSATLLAGTWASPGNTYTFRADGTYVSANVTEVSAVGKGGDWAADGYTLFMRPTGEEGWVSTIGATTRNGLVIDSAVYQRQP